MILGRFEKSNKRCDSCYPEKLVNSRYKSDLILNGLLVKWNFGLKARRFLSKYFESNKIK